MGHKLRHDWHNNMANAPKDGMSQGARPQASAAPPVGRNEKLWLSRKANFKYQGTLVKFFRSQTGVSQNSYQVDAVFYFL